MKKLSLLCSAAIVALAVTGAYAQIPNVSDAGAIIPNETALTWTKNYEAKGSGIKGHFYGKSVLNQLLSKPSAEGIIIFVGSDGQGQEHLIFKTLDKDGKIVNESYAAENGAPCPPYCPPQNVSAIGKQIEEGVAQQMISNFQANNKDRLFASSFSSALVKQVLGQAEAAGIYFANGLDEKNQEHLIFFGAKENGEIMWNGLAGENGFPCPPYCSEGYPPQSAAKKN